MRYLLTSLLCVFTLSLTAQEACPNVFDFDNDGNVAVNDFLAILGYFGDTDSDSDGVWDSEDDCVDETACNYQSNPTVQCYYIDEVGVCGGLCNEDADGDGICDFECGDQTGHEGYNYTTVQIGQQCWFSENCKYLPSVSPSNEWNNTDPYYYVYGYEGTDIEEAKATSNYQTYGVLYTPQAIMAEGLCPSGWHVPSDIEWQAMEMSLGMTEVEAASEGWRGTDEGYKMKSTAGWSTNSGDNTNGSNSSGFNGLPGGYMSNTYGFKNVSYVGFWWTSSDYGSNLWVRHIREYDTVLRNAYSFSGYSARCLMD